MYASQGANSVDKIPTRARWRMTKPKKPECQKWRWLCSHLIWYWVPQKQNLRQRFKAASLLGGKGNPDSGEAGWGSKAANKGSSYQASWAVGKEAQSSWKPHTALAQSRPHNRRWSWGIYTPPLISSWLSTAPKDVHSLELLVCFVGQVEWSSRALENIQKHSGKEIQVQAMRSMGSTHVRNKAWET